MISLQTDIVRERSRHHPSQGLLSPGQRLQGNRTHRTSGRPVADEAKPQLKFL